MKVNLSLTTLSFIASMILMVLKLVGVIALSWIFVFLPFIICIGLDIVIMIIYIIINTLR